jgi:Zn-dependent peptidase ImmA (M78 family)
LAAKINITNIADEVSRLIKKYDERDPARLAQSMKIMVDYMPMGLHEGCCKGFFIVHRRIKHITINCDLPEDLQRVVLAHELGHAVLHAKTGTVSQFHEMNLFDTVDTREYEANLFASELLLSDEDVLDALNEDAFFFQAARTLYVPSEMLDFKFRVMKRKGYKLESPVVSQSDFMKNLEKGFIPENNE